MSNFQIFDNTKFALLSVERVRSDIPSGSENQLSDGTWVLTKIPEVVKTDHWQKWLGTIWVERLERANLILFRSEPSTNPEVDRQVIRVDVSESGTVVRPSRLLSFTPELGMMPDLHQDIGCSQDELRILQVKCTHTVARCQSCNRGYRLLELKNKRDVPSHEAGGTCCPKCKNDLVASIRDHLTHCYNFPKAPLP